MALNSLMNVTQHTVENTDAIEDGVRSLESRLPQGTETELLIDFVEDDLREGFSALADIENHLNDIVDALASDDISPMKLLEVAEDFKVLNRLEYLMVVSAQLRRRLSQAAGKLHANR